MSELDKSSPYMAMVKNMMVDFVVHDMSVPKLQEKYHLTGHTVYEVIRVFKFREKKVRYQDRVLEKSLKKLATRQSTVLLKATMILQRQVDRIEKQQLRNPDKLIDPVRMKEVLAAFALLSKEYRLDNGQATDNQNISIRVEMGSNMPLVSENHLQHQQDNVIEVKEEKKPDLDTFVEATPEDIEVELDDGDNSMFGGID
jgi:predicted transcriptional regulator